MPRPTGPTAGKLLPPMISNSMRSILKHPQTFKQVIRQSDGSTFRIKTTSPKSMQTLTKDTLNHYLWNPSKATVIDTSGQLEKFKKRFGAVSAETESLSPSTTTIAKEVSADQSQSPTSQLDALLELAVGEAPKITEKKVIVKVVEQSAPKGKAAKAKAGKK